MPGSNNRWTLSLVWLVAAALAPTAAVIAYSDGPPMGHAGGFGEPDCRACHFDNPPGEAAKAVTLTGLPRHPIPGKRYPITLSLRDPNMARAGFQLTARFTGDGSQAGELISLGPEVRIDTDPATGVQYGRQTDLGASPVKQGLAQWQLIWRAPLGNGGATLFHIAANGANGDDSEFGDHIYSTHARIGPPSPPPFP